MDYLLRHRIEDADCDFLNSTSIKYDIVDSQKTTLTKLATDVDEMFDSGWCDMATGARIVSERDRVVFRNVSAQDHTLLLLKFGTRIRELHKGFKQIYRVTDE